MASSPFRAETEADEPIFGSPFVKRGPIGDPTATALFLDESARSANPEAYALARRLQQEGADRWKIWEETRNAGQPLFFDGDHFWHETGGPPQFVPGQPHPKDNAALLERLRLHRHRRWNEPITKPPEQPPATLKDILNHPEAYVAKPDLADIPIAMYMDENATRYASVYPPENRIEWTLRGLNDAQAGIANTATHEAQHIIDTEKYRNKLAENLSLIKDESARRRLLISSNVDPSWRHRLEPRAYNAAERDMRLTTDEKKFFPPWITEEEYENTRLGIKPNDFGSIKSQMEATNSNKPDNKYDVMAIYYGYNRQLMEMLRRHYGDKFGKSFYGSDPTGYNKGP